MARLGAAKHFLPALVFALCFGAYLSNGDFLPGNDQVGNMLFSVNLLKRHSFALSPPHAPEAFFWVIERPGAAPVRTTIDHWTDEVDTAYRQGHLRAPSYFYYLAATTRPEVYVNTFGIGAPLMGLPVYALLDLFVDLEADRFWWWHGAALTASLLTALAALFVFLAARGLVKPLPALLVALAFGLGSCAWPVTSQALWQHPASTFWLSLGAWFLLRSAGRTRAAAWCGAAFGMAVLCRPTTAVVALCAGAYLLWVDRRRCVAYVLGGLPFALILAAYNEFHFGSPFVFGQSVVAHSIALSKTGSADLWQSSWRESLPGLLFSPARGLVWFSPVLVLGTGQRGGGVERAALPSANTLAGGSRADDPGGRQVVRLVGRLDLGLPVHRRHHPVPCPVDDSRLSSGCVANRGTRVLFGALLAWSVAVQFVGAYSYSLMGWNELWREYEKPEQASLWQWQRPQIGYHVANFRAERTRKKQVMAVYLNYPGPILNLSVVNGFGSIGCRHPLLSGLTACLRL